MQIEESFLMEKDFEIKENIKVYSTMIGAFKLLSEDELDKFREQLYKESLEEFIAFSHVIDGIELNENMIRHVNSRGERGMRKTRAVRTKFAHRTTSLSKARRRETALKASKTRMANPSILKRAQRKRNKARRKRASLGFDL